MLNKQPKSVYSPPSIPSQEIRAIWLYMSNYPSWFVHSRLYTATSVQEKKFPWLALFSPQAEFAFRGSHFLSLDVTQQIPQNNWRQRTLVALITRRALTSKEPGVLMCDLISNYRFSFTHSSFDKVLGEEEEDGQGSNMAENSFFGKQYYNLFKRQV